MTYLHCYVYVTLDLSNQGCPYLKINNCESYFLLNNRNVSFIQFDLLTCLQVHRLKALLSKLWNT